MALSALTADSGATVSGLVQKGDIPTLQISSGSDQRLGSRQPVFYQTGTRAERVTIEFNKTNTTDLTTAITDRDQLRLMQGQRVVVLDQFGQTIDCFFHKVSASAKVGAGKWLCSAMVELEAMPSETPNAGQ